MSTFFISFGFFEIKPDVNHLAKGCHSALKSRYGRELTWTCAATVCYKLTQNICGFFLFNTSETELYYFYQKLNPSSFRKNGLGNKEILRTPRSAWISWQVPSQSPKKQSLTFKTENREKLALKNSKEKPVSLNF